jgi:hypothetical protein
MWPELLNMLPTRMRELHEWYMRATADVDVTFTARVKDSDLHRGLAGIWIDFESLWFLYHQDALGKSLSIFLSKCFLLFLYYSSTTYVLSHLLFFLYRVG